MGAESTQGQPVLSTAGSHHVVLSATDRTLIKRLYLADGETTVIWKEFLGPAGPSRRRREHAILLRLTGLPGMGRLARWTHPDAELLADEDERTLAYAIAAHEIDLAGVPRPAHRLARIVAGMHARGVVHKDLNTTNILVDDDGRPVVVDFDSCSLFTEDQAAFGTLREIEGTLHCLPPEQTGPGRPGRVGRHGRRGAAGAAPPGSPAAGRAAGRADRVALVAARGPRPEHCAGP
ncbi:phosphotransferase [Paractinoplanes maris]|uniref:phosphotransferase n=1 Tax=Paractinoplanes maris TaxID=1734446 RepID=UPI00202146CD|nr:phosphotransferase [Actinoplanes maris]